MIFSIGIIGIVEGNENNDVTLDEDDYDDYSLLFNDQGDDVDFTFTVTQGGNVDFYIMSYDEYTDHYLAGEDFNTSYSRENIKNVTDIWRQPDDQWYYIIIDNDDNNHTNDAQPSGSVTYDLDYKTRFEEEVENFLEKLGTAAFFCCAIVIIVIIVVILFFAVGKKKSNTYVRIQPPQASYPPQQNQQPPQYPQNPPQQYPPQQNQQPPQYPPQQNQQPPQYPQKPPQQYPPQQNQQPPQYPQKPPQTPPQ